MIWKETGTPMFIAALFTIAKAWKQPKCPSTEEWIKMWYIYTVEYYSAIKMKEIIPFAATWLDVESIILNEVSHTEKKNISWNPLYVKSKKKWYKWIYKREKETHKLRGRTYGCQGGRLGRRGSEGVLDGCAHTAIFKIDNQQRSTV